MDSRKFDSGTVWESEIKYSRAVRRGNFVAVSGTTAVDKDKLLGEGNAGEQARFIFQKIFTALREVGAQKDDIVRTRMYITNPNDADAVTGARCSSYRNLTSRRRVYRSSTIS